MKIVTIFFILFCLIIAVSGCRSKSSASSSESPVEPAVTAIAGIWTIPNGSFKVSFEKDGKGKYVDEKQGLNEAFVWEKQKENDFIASPGDEKSKFRKARFVLVGDKLEVYEPFDMPKPCGTLIRYYESNKDQVIQPSKSPQNSPFVGKWIDDSFGGYAKVVIKSDGTGYASGTGYTHSPSFSWHKESEKKVILDNWSDDPRRKVTCTMENDPDYFYYDSRGGFRNMRRLED